MFYVIEGTMTILVDDHWIDAAEGAFVLVPGGVTHDFQNRSAERAGVPELLRPRDIRGAHAGHRRMVHR